MADAFLSILETRSDRGMIDAALRAVQQYGESSRADRVARWASGAGVPEEPARRAREIEGQIRGRNRR